MSAPRGRKPIVHTMRDGWCTVCGEHLEYVLEHGDAYEDAPPEEDSLF